MSRSPHIKLIDVRVFCVVALPRIERMSDMIERGYRSSIQVPTKIQLHPQPHTCVSLSRWLQLCSTEKIHLVIAASPLLLCENMAGECVWVRVRCDTIKNRRAFFNAVQWPTFDFNCATHVMLSGQWSQNIEEKKRHIAMESHVIYVESSIDIWTLRPKRARAHTANIVIKTNAFSFHRTHYMCFLASFRPLRTIAKQI